MIHTLINSIKPLDKSAMDSAKKRQSCLAKPPGSLGTLEDISLRLAGITGKVHNTIEKKHLLVFASDNGVTDEGIASAPKSVTLKQAVNLTKAKTGAAVLAKHFGCGITVCDVGIDGDISGTSVLDRKIAFGTNNIVEGPAMTREQAIKAIITGAELAKETEADILGIGEMGIGNTTTASAVLSVLTDCDADAVTGRGGGITDEAFRRKKQVIKKAIEVNNPDREDTPRQKRCNRCSLQGRRFRYCRYVRSLYRRCGIGKTCCGGRLYFGCGGSLCGKAVLQGFGLSYSKP